MNALRYLTYRAIQTVLWSCSFLLPWRTPELLQKAGALGSLADHIRRQDVTSTLIITDHTIVELGLLVPLLEGLEAEGISYSIFDDTVPDPTIDNVESALRMFYDDGCEAIIGFGGGSPLDCAKGVAARVSRPKKSIRRLAGFLKVRRRTVHLYAVPTTAGTGSETTVAAVITDPETRRKHAVNDVCLIPDTAVLDPRLLTGLPPEITAYSGMDALCHAVEAYIGRSNTKETRQRSLEAVHLIFANLRASYEDGSSLEARSKMQLASFKAGQAFTRAYVGNVHAVAHTLGGFYHVPHGLANAVILPVMLEYYSSAVHDALAELADAVPLMPGGATAPTQAGAIAPARGGVTLPTHGDGTPPRPEVSPAEKARAFITAIRELNEAMNIPDGFDCIRDEDIPTMISHALSEANPVYPVPVILDREDMEEIYRRIQRPAGR